MSPEQATGHVEETRRFRLRDSDLEAGFFLQHLNPGTTLLDAGCGPGSITTGLAKRVAPANVIGIDADSARIDVASRDAVAAGVSNVLFQVADVTSLPFDDDSFDVVFANALIEHLPDPSIGIKELLRVLKPGGCIGLRSPDWGTALLHPESKPMLDSIALRNRWQRHRGGIPNAGRLLRGLLLSAGCLNVTAGATADSHGTESEAQEGVRYMHAILGDPELASLSDEHGWASADEIKAMRQSWTDWAAQPGAFTSFFWCHATGTK